MDNPSIKSDICSFYSRILREDKSKKQPLKSHLHKVADDRTRRSTGSPINPAPAELNRLAKKRANAGGRMTLKTFLLMVAAEILSGFNIQYRLLYYPSSSAPSEESLKADNIKPWQSCITDYRGLIATNEVGHTNGTIVVFHGNGGTAADRAFYVKALGTLGYRVILAEYPRYGGRKGELGEKAFVNDASETVRLAFVKYGEPVFVLGESLGCGVAAAIAKETSVKIDGIVLITPWDTLASVAQSKFPFLPVRLFLKDKYDNINNLKSFKGRIAVVGAGRDEVIPIRHANDLYNSLSGAAKRMWTIQGAGHNDWPMSTNRVWWKEIMDFVSNNDKGVADTKRKT